jgi:hypothetical protein
VAALPGAAAAAGPIAIEARTLVGGRFEAGGWVAIAVDLVNSGEPINGYVAAESEDGTVRRFVELPAGAHKQVSLYVRPPSFARSVAVRFEDQDGAQRATIEASVRMLERTTGHVAIVGDGGGNLRPQLISRAAGLPEPIPLTAGDLPDRPEPLHGVESIIWAADSGTQTEAQRRSLQRWIAAGGQLIVVGGPDWQARAAAFLDMLPVEGITSIDGASVAPLVDWIGAELPAGGETATTSVGTLRPGAANLVGAEDGVLFAAATRGAGRISWLGVDLATAPFRAWPGAPLFWSRLLPDDRLQQQFVGRGLVDDEVASAMVQALSDLPALEVPPAELLLAVLVAYILLIGPLSYLVLRRLDRRELAWITAPVLVIMFTTGTYGLGASLKGSDIIVNEIAVVRSTPGGTEASVSSFAGVYSPTRATYDVTVRGDALFSGLRNLNEGEPSAALRYATEQGDPSHLRGLAVGVSALKAVRAETVIGYSPSLRVAWSSTEAGVEGTVTNDGETAVEDVAVISESGGILIGTLEAGGSKAFTMSTRNFSGSAASEQVYGFSTGGKGSAAERQSLVRRQVIDALVGYGGSGSGGGGPGSGIDRGPFLIGWQTDASPMPVEIDGQVAQHYRQMVEVLSSNPQLGPGTVRIGPSQMVTGLISSAGAVDESEPGYVQIGEGEAIFQVNLPLEASGLAPSSIEVIAGGDPGIIFHNQGNMSATLPAGYRLSVYDHRAGDWIDVGDLSQRSHFTVDQPTRVLDDGGRILLLVSGSGIADDIGSYPVWVGAAVEGVV